MKEIIQIDDKHRVVLRKRYFRTEYAWDAVVEKKVFLLGWYTLRSLLNGWEIVYGLSHADAVEVAETAKRRLLESL